MRTRLIFSIFLVVLITLSATAQENSKKAAADTAKTEKKAPPKKAEKKKKKKGKAFADLIEDYEMIEGLFTFYRDANEGKIYMEIKPEQFDKIYLCNVTRESGDGTLFDGGAQLSAFPFFFKKVGKKVFFMEKNLRFRSDPSAAIHRAVARNLPDAMHGTAKIPSEPNEERGSILIDLNDFFLKDIGLVGHFSGRAKMPFSLDKGASFVSMLKSFPMNSEIETTLHFKSSKPQAMANSLADSRSMMHRYRFSLSTLPETNYQPRIGDDRVGHFQTIYQDYTSVLNDDAYVRYINRWHLEKSEPNFKISKPKQPIVFWLENTIPREFREAVQRGILAWNPAFEKIGFRDVLEVRQMPDNADWDPADVRYNTIRWIVQPGGAYAVGPSRANPFTGQIYDADIRISADLLRYQHVELAEFVQPTSIFSGESVPFFNETDGESWQNLTDLSQLCMMGEGMARQTAFGQSMLFSRNQLTPGSEAYQRYISDALASVVTHEVGHTLGLRHNFKASTIHSLAEMQDRNFTVKHGLTGSIMDYTAVNIAPKKSAQGDYFQLAPGPYDEWAIEYAYTLYDPNSNISEKEMLARIARRGAEDYLQYGTDEDAFGGSSRAIDPRANLWDIGDNPLEFYRLRLDLTRELWQNLEKSFEKKGMEYDKLRRVFTQGVGEYLRAGQSVSRYIGGIYHHRDHVGDPGGRKPYQMVPAEKQQEALQFLIERYFQPDAFQFAPTLLNKLGASRQWNFSRTILRAERLDYPIHGIVQVIQVNTLRRLFHHRPLLRIQDNEIRFEKGEPFRMTTLFSEIRNAIWQEAAAGKNVNSFRRELQRIHLFVLENILLRRTNFYPRDAVTLARADLAEIKKMLQSRSNNADLDTYTIAHFDESLAKIDAMLEAHIQRK